MQPMKSTISRAIRAARARSNGSSCTPTNAGYKKKQTCYSNNTQGQGFHNNVLKTLFTRKRKYLFYAPGMVSFLVNITACRS
jgi:hypothetical protein